MAYRYGLYLRSKGGLITDEERLKGMHLIEMIDAVYAEGEKVNYNMSWKKIKDWYEAIGLAVLLFAFGWQCFEEHSNQMKMEGLLYEVHENIFAIWESVYDEALSS